MITWTTYGTWLQGEKKGYVKNGQILDPCKALHEANKKNLISEPVKFDREQKNIVEKAILSEAEKLEHKIYALAVCSNHVHLVTNCIDETIGKVTGRYKKAATAALKTNGFGGRVWTKGYDKRYCFNEKSLKDKIDYVRRHD